MAVHTAVPTLPAEPATAQKNQGKRPHAVEFFFLLFVFPFSFFYVFIFFIGFVLFNFPNERCWSLLA